MMRESGDASWQDARVHRIVVDAMGGDHAPDEIVQGAAEASLALPSAEIILVGDASVLGRILPRLRHDGARMRVHHASTHVEMDEKPAERAEQHGLCRTSAGAEQQIQRELVERIR
jgi:fatty acid/phospholipid biosynthesis enzyme